MKKLILSLFIIAFTFSINAQEKGKIRVGIDLLGLSNNNTGSGLPGGGINGSLDIRYNILNNLNAGIKLGGGAAIKDYDYTDAQSDFAATFSAITFTLLTSDYYFNKPGSSFAPYIGGGLGRYTVANIHMSTADDLASLSSMAVSYDKVFGGLIRGGFEAGHFRIGLEYYLIPKTTLYDIVNFDMGSIKNSYLNLSIGFYFGGGKWRNN